MSFEKMTLQQRVQAANIDCMRHPEYARLSGCICMGKSDVVPEGGTIRIKGKEIATGKEVWVDVPVPTACTDGQHKYYGAAFIGDMTRKQLRYLVLHENFHVAFKHCTLYTEASQKHPELAARAADYVCNGNIEELDPEFKFVERPTKVPPLVDEKYQGWSFPQVFNDLFKQQSAQQKKQGGKGKPGQGQPGVGQPGGTKQGGKGKPGQGQPGVGQPGGTMDEHIQGQYDAEAPQGGKSAAEKLGQMVNDANRQGEILSARLRGDSKGGRDIFELAKERNTNWKEPMRDWIQSVSVGDDQSRFCPPNRRLLASGFCMPSHFSETVGGIILACDTSGSMVPYYPVIFGEVARICQDVRPEWVRMLWWDTEVGGDQKFTPDNYEDIAKQLKPAGGGGTTISCVAQYIKDQEIKGAVAIVYLSDGYVESEYSMPELPALWGIVENENFVPKRGKVLRIVV